MMTNIMIAESILNLLGSLSMVPTTQADLNGSNNFEALMKKSLLNSLQAGETKNAASANGLTLKKADKQIYLEALRKKLLAKGKSLDKIYLKGSDINSITTFLTQCGFSKDEATQCINKLLESNSNGKIKLSDIFSEIETHLSSQASGTLGKNKSYRSVNLEPSVIPSIESALKDLGLSLSDVDNTINAARSNYGGLDLNKLIAQLKTLKNKTDKKTGITEEKVSAAKFLEKHEKLGLQITPDEETGLVSIDGFVTALEKFKDGLSGKTDQTENRKDRLIHSTRNIIGGDTANNEENFQGKENISKIQNLKPLSDNFEKLENSSDKIPLDVKASINKIMEKTVSPEENFKLKLNGPSLSQLKSKAIQAEHKVSDTDQIFQGDNISAPAKNSRNRIAGLNKQTIQNSDTSRQEVLSKISDINDISANIKDANLEKDIKDVKLKSVEVAQEVNSAGKFETFTSTFKARTDNGVLPANTLEMLGKQISKSVARGDRIINLQLTPPELGSVKLSMEIKDSVLQIKMVTENSSAKDVLLANSNDLKNILANQGIKLDRLDVQVETNFGGALSDLNTGFGGEQKQFHENGGNVFSGDSITEEISSDVLNKAARDNLLDLTA